MKFISSLRAVEHDYEEYVGVVLPNASHLFFRLDRGEYFISTALNDEGWTYDKEGLDDLLTALLELRKELDK